MVQGLAFFRYMNKQTKYNKANRNIVNILEINDYYYYY